jgi:hypothetical protein
MASGPTLPLSRAWKLKRSVSCRASAPVPDCVKTPELGIIYGVNYWFY